MLHECSIRVPMIVYDPDTAADSTRGQRTKRWSSPRYDPDLPRCVRRAGCWSTCWRVRACGHGARCAGSRIARRRLRRDRPFSAGAQHTGKEPAEARGFMIRTYRWKYPRAEGCWRSCSISKTIQTVRRPGRVSRSCQYPRRVARTAVPLAAYPRHPDHNLGGSRAQPHRRRAQAGHHRRMVARGNHQQTRLRLLGGGGGRAQRALLRMRVGDFLPKYLSPSRLEEIRGIS